MTRSPLSRRSFLALTTATATAAAAGLYARATEAQPPADVVDAEVVPDPEQVQEQVAGLAEEFELPLEQP